MATAQEVLIANAVAAELNQNGQAWAPLPNLAARSWSPWFQSDTFKTLQVFVVPTRIPKPDDPRDRVARGGQSATPWLWDYEVWIDLQQEVPITNGLPDQPTIDGLCLIAQQMQDWFNTPQLAGTPQDSGAHELATLPGWWVVGALRPRIFDEAILLQHHVFETQLRLIVRGYR